MASISIAGEAESRRTPWCANASKPALGSVLSGFGAAGLALATNLETAYAYGRNHQNLRAPAVLIGTISTVAFCAGQAITAPGWGRKATAVAGTMVTTLGTFANQLGDSHDRGLAGIERNHKLFVGGALLACAGAGAVTTALVHQAASKSPSLRAVALTCSGIFGAIAGSALVGYGAGSAADLVWSRLGGAALLAASGIILLPQLMRHLDS